jgi:hypothetical protein
MCSPLLHYATSSEQLVVPFCDRSTDHTYPFGEDEKDIYHIKPINMEYFRSSPVYHFNNAKAPSRE